MNTKDDKLNKELCMSLMKANSEDEIVKLLTKAGYWDKKEAWRYYGDRASNFNTIGNQQSRPDAALVEKLVNSVDARLINECLIHGIDPESKDAPRTIREAVAKFFDGGSDSSNAGLIREWPAVKRTEIAKGITLVATGNKPNQGNPCFVIADIGEGQTPRNLPNTILSLDKDNKIRIPFVQGKFNMGGTGVLEFCGKRNLQLVLSRRNPSLNKGKMNSNDAEWGYSMVRREEPIGGRKTSVYTYLAPTGSDKSPNKGEVLSFASETMPLFPVGQNPFEREVSWGTLIKLYEYSTAGFSATNILLSDGLMRQLDLLLTNLALPIRLYECRKYSGHSGSFETNLTGIGVRLEDDKRNNLEEDPYSCSINVLGEKMTANIFVFKKEKADNYRSSEGIIFSLNGQTHGYLTKNFFRRKKVGMSYLADSLLVIIDCSQITLRSREILFMPSRDRLRDSELKIAIEAELEEIISNHSGLKSLREKRRREEVETMLGDEKPLSDILQDLIKESPTLTALFLQGKRISNPFNLVGVQENPKNNFKGERFPTFFKFENVKYGETLIRNCNINTRARVTFETDAENSYFSRDAHRGTFELYLSEKKGHYEVEHTMNLWNGIGTLNLKLPPDCEENERLELVAYTNDYTQIKPYKNNLVLNILGPVIKTTGGPGGRRKPPSTNTGKDRETPSGVDLPNIIKVARIAQENQKGWNDMSPPFNEYSALRIIHAGSQSPDENTRQEEKEIYDFYVNTDNIYLKTEQKNSKEDAEVLSAKFIYALVLLGLSIINFDLQKKENYKNAQENSLEERVENFSLAVAPVLIPIINELSGIELEDSPII